MILALAVATAAFYMLAAFLFILVLAALIINEHKDGDPEEQAETYSDEGMTSPYGSEEERSYHEDPIA